MVSWGVMMAAMMLPSATPMILLYRTVSVRLAANGEASASVALFASAYVALWVLTGVPVYFAYVAVAAASSRWTWFAHATPYAVALVLIAAGLYQLTDAKRVCLRYCESPLGFFMRRWKAGVAATLRIALLHAGYCVGCCWALMVVLVAAGAMSIPWVLTITIIVFAEKVLPFGWRTARVAGVCLIVLGVAVAVRPKLAATMRPQMNRPTVSGDIMNMR